MQQESETMVAMAAKASPPVTVSIATVAGYPVNELLMWATLLYTVLLIGHKLWQIWCDVRKANP